MVRKARDQEQAVEQPTPTPVVSDERIQKRTSTVDVSNVPIRTIIAVEVGDLPVSDVQKAIRQLVDIYQHDKHPTYIIPTRNSRMTSDIIFEEGIEELVQKLCEIKDGKICLKNGWREVDVARFAL